MPAIDLDINSLQVEKVPWSRSLYTCHLFSKASCSRLIAEVDTGRPQGTSLCTWPPAKATAARNLF